MAASSTCAGGEQNGLGVVAAPSTYARVRRNLDRWACILCEGRVRAVKLPASPINEAACLPSL
eukprot:scaffold160267_cov19-Tisochrysis_lutea.AAC.1